MNTSYSQQKPGLVTAIAVMTLTSGILNLFWGFVAFGSFFGIICLPITILPTILGIFEIIYAAKLLSAQLQPVQPSPSIAAFEIVTVLMGNVFSMVVGIMVLIFYNDLTVKEYFTHLNEKPVLTVPAAVVIEPVTEPVVEELPAPQEVEVVETPKARKKPGSRKTE